MDSFRRLVSEAHRRSLWQVLSVYLVGSWGALQVVEGITENAGLPDWVPPFALVLLVVGLPVVLATAFVQEGVGGVREEGPNAPAPATVAAPPSRKRRAHHRLFTWRNAMLGGAGAFGLLGLASAGYLAMWKAGLGPVGSLVAQGVLAERDPVVLAEFENNTAEPALGEMATEALRVDLLASPVVTVVEPGFVNEVLRRMERDPSEPLRPELAREVAVREGLKAVIEGEVGAVGSGYLITARIVSAADGALLAGFRRTAADEAALLDALDALSQDIRQRAGESLRSIRGGEPLESVTTSSLDALRKFTQGMAIADRGDHERGIELLREAVAADSTFAMAWRKLAVLLNNAARGAEADSAAARAYRLRDRLPDRERYHAVAFYHWVVTHERDAAARAWTNVLEAHPDDGVALNNLALHHMARGEYEEALALLERALAGAGESSVVHLNRVEVLSRLRRWDEARVASRAFAERYPESPRTLQARSTVEMMAGEWAAAEAMIREAEADLPASERAGATRALALIQVAQGRLLEAEETLRRLPRMPGRQGRRVLGDLATMDRVLRSPEASLRRLERLAADPLLGALAGEPVTAHHRAEALAALGETERALAVMEAAEEAARSEGVPESELEILPARLAATAALARGQWDAALEAFEELRRREGCARAQCYGPQVGMAHEGAGRSEAAIDAYRAWLDHPDLAFASLVWRNPVRERLARLQEAAGDRAGALATWRALEADWRDADPELRPRAAHARARIAELGG